MVGHTWSYYSKFCLKLIEEAHVLQSLRHSLGFQNDGAPSHDTNDAHQHLKITFGQHLMGRGGPVHWLARSPDLSWLDFFWWGQMKTWVYETSVDVVEDLVARISVAVGEKRGTPGSFQNVRNFIRLAVKHVWLLLSKFETPSEACSFLIM